MKIRNLHISDYESVMTIWREADGVEIAEGDSRESIARYIDRNPTTSKVAEHNSQIVAAVLCGHDGRRGIIYHLAVLKEYRNQGIGTQIIKDCLYELKNEGVERVIILVDKSNDSGREFWTRRGWELIDQAIPLGINI